MKEFALAEKPILVTGASRGIGRSIAVSLGEAGAFVGVGHSGSSESSFSNAEEVVSQIKKSGGNAKAIKINVSEVEDSAAAVKEMVGEFGSLYGLVNNAGIVIDNLTLRYKESDFDQIFSVNTKGSFFLIKEALRPMMKNRDSGAAIVNLSSVVGQMGGVGQVPYSATKGAVISMTKSLAREYAAKNIRVNGVAPGFIETDMTNDLTEDAKKMMLDNIPLKRTAQAEEVAWGVKFLLSPKASYITGHILNINGGLYI